MKKFKNDYQRATFVESNITFNSTDSVIFTSKNTVWVINREEEKYIRYLFDDVSCEDEEDSYYNMYVTMFTCEAIENLNVEYSSQVFRIELIDMPNPTRFAEVYHKLAEIKLMESPKLDISELKKIKEWIY